MLQTELYVFKDADYTADPESIITTGMTRKLSDVIDLVEAKINNGGSNLWLVVSAKDRDDAAGGKGFNIELMECATTDGVYTAAAAKFVPLASVVTGAALWRVALPQDLQRFVKVRIAPLPTEMSGREMLITAAATSDSAEKVAGLIRAAAAQFLPGWVVTGATTDVIFTAAAVGVKTGTVGSFDGGGTGIMGSIDETDEGEAAVEAVYTLTIATACAATGYILIDLDKVAMTDDAHFNAAIVTS